MRDVRHAARRLVLATALLLAACSDDADDAGPEATAAGRATTTREAGSDFSAVGPIVEDFVADHGLEGAGLVVVEREDGVVHEQYWGAFDGNRISLVASSSKMITAGVLLRLHDDGLLDIDAPVADVAPWGAGNPEVTPAQLVSNSSGLLGLLPDPAYAPYICQFVPDGSLQDCASAIFTTAADDTDVVAPDTEFRYGGAQWQVAGAVAEIAAGRSWAELVEEIYVRPCGLEAWRSTTTSPSSGPSASTTRTRSPGIRPRCGPPPTRTWRAAPT
jgi:CubicO group peptidase (beta-lactamase class C family)